MAMTDDYRLNAMPGLFGNWRLGWIRIQKKIKTKSNLKVTGEKDVLCVVRASLSGKSVLFMLLRKMTETRATVQGFTVQKYKGLLLLHGFGVQGYFSSEPTPGTRARKRASSSTSEP
jgi:hypothetical protein